MSSIPLPALDLKPVQQPNILENYGQLMQLHNMAQNAPLQNQLLQQQVQGAQAENQQRQQALKDQQAMTTAMQQWDGKSLNDLAPLVLKNGGSAQAVMGLKQKSLEMQQTYSKIAADDATTGSTNLATQMKKNDIISGAFQTVLQTPDAQLPQAVVSTAQQLSQQGLLDPQHVQMAQQIAQSGDPNQIRTSLDTMRKGMLATSQLMDDAQKQAATIKDSAQANEATANANAKNQEIQNGGTSAMADSRYRNIVMNQKLGRPTSPDDAAWAAAYKQQKTLNPVTTFNLQNSGLGGPNGQPSAIAKGLADGSVKWGDVVSARTPIQVKQQLLGEVKALNPNFNSGDFTVEQKAREAFTSGNYSQQLNSINTAREHMKTFTSLADALDNGNVQVINQAGNALGMQLGSDKATNFNIAKQAFSAEVAKAFSGAGVTEGDRKEIGDKISSASSPAQLRGAAATADALLAGKQKALQQTYSQSQQGSPNFGGNAGASPSGGPPPGATHIVPGSDGHNHYTDGTRDLGIAP